MKTLGRYKVSIALIITALLVWFFVFVLVFNSASERKDVYLSTKNIQLQNQLEGTIKSYQAFSRYLYESVIDETVIMLMVSAQESSTREQARNDLYAYLEDDYETMISYDFRQFHFQLPNGDSLLRFHLPDTYGDNMFSTRETIRIANEEKRYAHGFEAGRIYHGYRFVYPIFEDETHLGSVEISISFVTLLEMIYTINTESDAFFIMKNTTVDEQIFEELLEYFEPSALASHYYNDRLVEDDFMSMRRHFNGVTVNDFFTSLSGKVEDQLNSEESFSTALRFEGKPYTIHFVAVSNLLEEHVGYIITVEEDGQYFLIQSETNSTLIILSLFFLFIIITIIVFFKEREKLRYLSRHDTLTGLYNRRSFNAMFAVEWERAMRYDRPLSLLVFDIDHFKQVNDTFGHLRGDKVLIELANCLLEALRVSDITARWGGEEFILLLPETSQKQALIVAEKLRKRVEEKSFKYTISITVSVGVSTSGATDQSMQEIINRADKALYKAKEDGRNKVKFL